MAKATTKVLLQNVSINIKIKLSALWGAVTLCYLYGDYFELYVPKKVDGLLTGHHLLDSPARLFAASFALSIPALMVALSIFLPPTINRLLNIIVGLFFTTVTGLIAIASTTEWLYFYLFLAIVESIVTALIVWIAWKWPKQTDPIHFTQNKAI